MAKKEKKPADELDLEEEEVVITDEDEEIVSLDTIKKSFLKKGKEQGYINTDDIMEATAHLDLSDEDFEGLIEYFRSSGIEIESDEPQSDDELAMEMDVPESFEDAEKEMEEDEIDADEDEDNLSEEEKESLKRKEA